MFFDDNFDVLIINKVKCILDLESYLGLVVDLNIRPNGTQF